MQKLVIGIVATCAMLAMAAGAASAQRLSAGGKCEAAKNQEAGKYAACLHKAEARRIKTKGQCSITSATACFRDDDCPLAETCTKDLAKVNAAVAKCGTKFAGKWDKLTQQAVAKLDPCPDGLLVEEFSGSLDAQVAKSRHALSGKPRFADNADGTVTDNDTGLIWEKKLKLDATADVANLQDADNFYRWSGSCSVATSKRCQPNFAASTACFAGVEGNTTGCDECTGGDGVCNVGSPGITIWQWLNDLNAANYGGHNDWRMPRLQDLSGIVDYADSVPSAVNVAFHGVSCGVACTDVTDPACSCTRSDGYWSASTYALNPVDAWFVSFYDGTVGADFKTFNFYVRAVRGGS